MPIHKEMAENQTELWQMACTFQGKHNMQLQFGKSCMGLDACYVCKTGRGRDSHKMTLSATSLVVGSTCVVFSRTSATTPGCIAIGALKQCFANPGKKVSLRICSWLSQESVIFAIPVGGSYFHSCLFTV